MHLLLERVPSIVQVKYCRETMSDPTLLPGRLQTGKVAALEPESLRLSFTVHQSLLDLGKCSSRDCTPEGRLPERNSLSADASHLGQDFPACPEINGRMEVAPEIFPRSSLM